MNEQQALEAARQIGVCPGLHPPKSEGMIKNPHLHSGQQPPMHVDAWKVANVGGQLQAQKFHTPG